MITGAPSIRYNENRLPYVEKQTTEDVEEPREPEEEPEPIQLPTLTLTFDASITQHLGGGYDNDPFDWEGDLLFDYGDGTTGINTLLHNYSDTEVYTVSVTGNIKKLNNTGFWGFRGMTCINISSSVTAIGSSCFHICSDLIKVYIPDSVTSIGKQSFYNCNKLTRVNIPSSVTSIGEECFKRCTSLIDYQLYWNTNIPEWSNDFMPNNTDTVFTIPKGTTELYVNANYPSDKLVEREE